MLGRAEPALHHARRCVELAAAHQLPDWLVASGHEALTRAYAVAGNRGGAGPAAGARAGGLERVGDPEERQVVESDLAGIPL